MQKLKDYYQAHKREHWKKNNDADRLSVLVIVAKSTTPKCVRCGCDDMRLLEVNHRDGGGGKEMRGGGRKFHRDIIMLRRATDDLEILCKPCNGIHYLELKYGKLPFVVTWKSQA